MKDSYGKYQILEQVGEGGFGRVYRALDPLLKREVAVKTCTLTSAEVRARFVQEAEIVARLEHPNIVTVYDFGVEDGEPYLVQEFLSGADLQEIMTRGVALETERRVEWLRQVAAGLRHAHEKGIIHRDIKPSNIRILADGSVRIMDFGIAKLREAEQSLTRTGISIGTSGYLAPEQVNGLPIDHRADIFSFGVLAYQLMSGRRPFAAATPTAELYRAVHEPHAPLRDVAPDCPPRVAACIERCLEKERDLRPPSMAAVLAGLDGAREPVAVPATAVSEPAERRRLSPAAIAMGIAFAGLVGFAVLTLTNMASSNEDVPAHQTDPLPPPPPDGGEQPVAQNDTARNDTAQDETVSGGGGSRDPIDRGTPPDRDAATETVVLDPRRVLVFVNAVPAAYGEAESTVFAELEREGFTVVDAMTLDDSPAADAGTGSWSAFARGAGAARVIVVDVTADAQPSVGGMFTGTAAVRARGYDAATAARVLDATGEVGGGTPGKLAATAEAALREAVRAAAYQAARRAVADLPR